MRFVIFKERRIKKAQASYSFGKREQALKLAKPLLDCKEKKIAYAANRLSGLIIYQQKQYANSLPCLHKACQLGNFQHDWYNYATALAYSGDEKQAEEAFQNVYRTKVEPGYLHSASIPVMLFQYIKALKQTECKAIAKARANELKQMYSSIGVLNTSNERSRGLPAYKHFRKIIAPLFEVDEFIEWEKNLKIEQ